MAFLNCTVRLLLTISLLATVNLSMARIPNLGERNDEIVRSRKLEDSRFGKFEKSIRTGKFEKGTKAGREPFKIGKGGKHQKGTTHGRNGKREKKDKNKDDLVVADDMFLLDDAVFDYCIFEDIPYVEGMDRCFEVFGDAVDFEMDVEKIVNCSENFVQILFDAFPSCFAAENIDSEACNTLHIEAIELGDCIFSFLDDDSIWYDDDFYDDDFGWYDDDLDNWYDDDNGNWCYFDEMDEGFKACAYSFTAAFDDITANDVLTCTIDFWDIYYETCFSSSPTDWRMVEFKGACDAFNRCETINMIESYCSYSGNATSNAVELLEGELHIDGIWGKIFDGTITFNDALEILKNSATLTPMEILEYMRLASCMRESLDWYADELEDYCPFQESGGIARGCVANFAESFTDVTSEEVFSCKKDILDVIDDKCFASEELPGVCETLFDCGSTMYSMDQCFYQASGINLSDILLVFDTEAQFIDLEQLIETGNASIDVLLPAWENFSSGVTELLGWEYEDLKFLLTQCVEEIDA